jgi:hypothetical protein
MALPPPRQARTFASPFAIDGDLYNMALDWKVPVTIGALYASTAMVMNKINRDRHYKPWGISKAKSFYVFVLLHNIFLAVFSALTFMGMIRALAHTWPSRRSGHFFGKDWPGLRTINGLAGAADALCKLHGPSGLGNAVFYQPDKNSYTSTNPDIALTANGLPNPNDVGRLWNEGLAFWGWFFYLSKFYEVLDTFIILAKGKRSSTLQTYHHTGAMACVWAGIRYMSSPIWLFCFLNSGIHALMYTYYTLSALNIKVPQRVKRTLTTMQISQFLIGITFATLHLFVIYSIPVSTSYTVSKTISSAASAASAAAAAAASAAPSSLGTLFKKFILRALGEPGMAERVDAPRFINRAGNLVNSTQETKWRTEFAYIPCIDTEGQAFAIWLNVFYLAPLTGLFVRFFIRSYSNRGPGRAKKQDHRLNVSKAATDAAREFDSLGKAAENGVGDLANGVLNRMNGTHSTPNANGRQSITQVASKTQDETPAEQKQSMSITDSSINRSTTPEHLRASAIRKKASAEHNKLRSMFEDGKGFGEGIGSDFRSVNTRSNTMSPHLPETFRKSNKTKQLTTETSGKSQPYAEDLKAVDELQRVAEEKVREVMQAVGGQSARSPTESITGDGDDAGFRSDSSDGLWRPERTLAEELAGYADSEATDKTGLTGTESEELRSDIEEGDLDHASYAQVAASTPDPSSNDVVENAPRLPALDTNEYTPSPAQGQSDLSHITTIPSLKPEDASLTSFRTVSPTPSPRLKSKIPKPSNSRGRSPAKMTPTPALTTTSTTVPRPSPVEQQGTVRSSSSSSSKRGRSRPDDHVN